jgi:hypothetical protein
MFTFKKKYTSEHPLPPDLRPDSESLANFGLEQTFKIFKSLQKYISTSGVNQGHSTSTCVHSCVVLNFSSGRYYFN